MRRLALTALLMTLGFGFAGCGGGDSGTTTELPANAAEQPKADMNAMQDELNKGATP